MAEIVLGGGKSISENRWSTIKAYSKTKSENDEKDELTVNLIPVQARNKEIMNHNLGRARN